MMFLAVHGIARLYKPHTSPLAINLQELHWKQISCISVDFACEKLSRNPNEERTGRQEVKDHSQPITNKAAGGGAEEGKSFCAKISSQLEQQTAYVPLQTVPPLPCLYSVSVYSNRTAGIRVHI